MNEVMIRYDECLPTKRLGIKLTGATIEELRSRWTLRQRANLRHARYLQWGFLARTKVSKSAGASPIFVRCTLLGRKPKLCTLTQNRLRIAFLAHAFAELE